MSGVPRKPTLGSSAISDVMGPEAEIVPFGHIYPLTYHSLSGLAAHQSRDMDSPARSGAYPASLWDTNSVKSRTRLVLRVSPCVRSQSVPYICRSVPGTLTSRGSDEARQCRDPETLPYSNDLRLGVRGPEGNPRSANLTLAGPVRNSMHAYDDPPDGIRRARTPRG